VKLNKQIEIWDWEMRTGIRHIKVHGPGKKGRITSVNLDTYLLARARERDMIRPGRLSDLVNTALYYFISEYDRVKKEQAARKAEVRIVTKPARYYRTRKHQNHSIYQGISQDRPTQIKKEKWVISTGCKKPVMGPFGTKTRQPSDSILMEHPVPLGRDSTPPGDTPLQGPGPTPQPGPGPS